MLGLYLSGSLEQLRNPKIEKWHVPSYALDDEVPPYLSGPLFLIPKWSISCLATAMWKTPILYIEDLYISGLLAKVCQIPLEDVSEFNGQREDIPDDAILEKLQSSQKHIMFHLGKTPGVSKTKFRLYREYWHQNDQKISWYVLVILTFSFLMCIAAHTQGLGLQFIFPFIT